MNAIMYMYVISIKNWIFEGIRSPKRLAKALGLTFIFLMFVLGAASGVVVSAAPIDLPLLKGMMFVLFLVPFAIGRYGGIGPFGNEHMNFIFTAPILPRTVLLAEILRRFRDMVVISLAVMAVFAFTGLTVVMEIRHIVLAGVFCLILCVVCKLFGMYLFVAYKGIYRLIGLFWLALLLVAGVFYFARAGWMILPGLLNFLDSYVFALTPLVGWASAGAFAFMTGNVTQGIVFTGLLVVAGGYFFGVVYKSSPDFYDEAIGAPDVADVNYERVNTSESSLMEITTTNSLTSAKSNFRGIGAEVFFYKHLSEESGGWASRTRIPWIRNTRAGAVAELIGSGIFAGIAAAIIWGLYARGLGGDIEHVAMIFRTIGVPSSNILAVLIPAILILTAYPQYDKGFIELYNPYFYLIPDSPVRKLLWVSMARIIKVCAVAVLVLLPAGFISGTPPVVILATLLAYLASAFMVLGLRLAIVRFLGVVSGGRQKLVATLPVLIFVLAGVVGMLAVFYFGAESWGLFVSLIGFTGYSGLTGVLAFLFSLRVLHDVDAPV